MATSVFKSMLNISFIFDDANSVMANYANHLVVSPLPAVVYMMQMDVINHYRYALEHYFTLTLDEPFLQNSSIGTPYQKWAYFTNHDFEMLSFAIHNLLRYTSRLVHETECVAMKESERYTEMKGRSNLYTSPICEVRFRNKSIGISVHEDNQLSIVAIRTERGTERVTARSSAGGPTRYFLITSEEVGDKDHEQPIDKEEFQRITETIRAEKIDIRDRSMLATLRERGRSEIAGLIEKNRIFAQACNEFYQTRNVAEPFDKLNESFWI